MAKIAVMGHGVVGSGVVEVLLKNEENISKKAFENIEVKYILDIRDFHGLTYENKFIKNFDIILNDEEISVVAEVMGGLNPAYDFVKACLLKGKSVVTSNKELVAMKGAELVKIAKDNGVSFLFEASVGGGIPIIRPIYQCLAANEIDEIAGILNGTTNFILTKMIKEKMSFEEALHLAQELGYAERDPSADVDGHDTCRKICILASIISGKHIYPDSVSVEGITKITLKDADIAESMNSVIKLIGRAKKLENGKLLISVSPAILNKNSQLAGIDDVFNGILVRGDSTGDVVFYGKGAGKLPTASAVVADIIDCIKSNGKKHIYWEDNKEEGIVDSMEAFSQFYIRLNVSEVDINIKDEIKNNFGNVKYIDIDNDSTEEIVFTTKELNEGHVISILEKMSENKFELLSKIRIFDY